MTMTRKDYNAVANAIREDALFYAENAEAFSAVCEVARNIAVTLYLANANFDREKFYDAACGGIGRKSV